MITSATSIAVKSDSNETQMEDAFQFVTVPYHVMKAVKVDNTPSGPQPLFAGNQITAGTYDSFRPSLCVDPMSRFYIGLDFTEDGSIYYPMFTYSTDLGSTWGDGAYFSESANAKKPDVDYKSTGFFATMDPPYDNTGVVFIVDASIIDDPTGFYWDLAPDIDNIRDVHIGTYTHEGPNGDPGVWNFGLVSFVGDNWYTNPDIIDCPLVMYSNSETGGVFGWMTNSDGCKHSSTEIDLGTNMSYSVYDRDNAGKYELLVRKDNFGAWAVQGDFYYHSNVFGKKILGTGNLTYPDVVADSNNVIIVAQTDEGGNQDIICYYSSNGMSSYNNVIVSSGAEDELYPQITWIKSGVAVCSYIKGTEAYYRSTEDGGVTWSEEARVSDEVLEPIEDHAVSITGINGNAYAAWQDGRGDVVDIYWDSFYNVASPNVQIGTIGGGIGKVTMEVKNIGTGAASDVDWSISVTGGMLGKINVVSTGNIPTLAAGGTQTVKTDKFIFGLGSISIQLTAGAATATKAGKVLFVLVRNIA
jgi:hypothetical protein